MSSGSITITPGYHFDEENGEALTLPKINDLGQPGARVDEGAITRRELQNSILEQIDGSSAGLATEITVRAAADEALAAQITTLEASMETADAVLLAAIELEQETRATTTEALARTLASLLAIQNDQAGSLTHESTVRASADEVLAQDILTLEADFTAADAALSAAITVEQTARTDADSALATSITELTADMASADGVLTAALTAEEEARADGDGALASAITTLEAAMTTADDTLASSITAEQTARVSATEAIARTISNILATMNDQSAAVSVLAEAFVDATGQIIARYSLKLDVNGFVTGFETTNGGPGNDYFDVLTTNFRVRDPSAPAMVPFEVVGGVLMAKQAIIPDIAAEKLIVGKLEDLTQEIGTLRTTSTGARTEIKDNLIECYDEDDNLRVRLGVWE